MKKPYTLLGLCLLFSLSLTAQSSFSDDFEAYENAAYVGASSDAWTTWSGTTGGAEDVQVTEDQAASGTKSIYLASTAANGGPQDILLPFGAKHINGIFNLSMKVLVDEGKGAYWNFQGETTAGQAWTHNAYLYPSGAMQFTDGGNVVTLATSYEFEKWISIDYLVNLTENSWQVSINGECLGSFNNATNELASLNLYPRGGEGFYVDDVSYSYEPDVKTKQFDAAISMNDLGIGGLTGMNLELSGTIMNTGTDSITTATILVPFSDGDRSFTFDDLNLANGEAYDFVIPEKYILEEGDNSIMIEIQEINGDADADEEFCNNRSSGQLRAVTPAEGKNIIVEEGTGTWCGFCPRGAVFLERLTKRYGNRFVGIAVHNRDPMVVAGYDGQHGFSGYPGATVMRRSASTSFSVQSDLELPFLEYITQAPKATFEIGAALDEDTRSMDISVIVSAHADLDEEHRLAIVITEDGVTGTSSGYAQSNYYAGGGRGPMGGYENLPSTIPASDMVYDHVARAIPLGYEGADKSFENELTDGNNRIYSYQYEVPEDYDLEKMHIVMVLLNPDGTIDNGQSTSITEALVNGLSVNTSSVITNDLSVFPNPAHDALQIRINTDEALTIEMDVVNVLGQSLLTEQFSTTAGLYTHDLSLRTLPQGTYFAILKSGKLQNVVKFIKQ